MASAKLVNEAKKAFITLKTVQGHMRAHKKVLYCLPKHKEKRFERLSTQLNVKLFNAESAWYRAVEKLAPAQVDSLYKELVV